MKTFVICTLSLFVLFLSGCNKEKIPGVYRIDIQQGNDINQDMINKLKPGMNKNQVSFIMGTPLLIDTFHPNRWDYIYSFHPGNGQREQRRVTLFFDENEQLTHLVGNVKTVAQVAQTDTDRSESNVVVPLTEKKTGFFQGFMNTIGLGEEEVKKIEPKE